MAALYRVDLGDEVDYSLKLQQNRDDSVHASLMICKGNKV